MFFFKINFQACVEKQKRTRLRKDEPEQRKCFDPLHWFRIIHLETKKCSSLFFLTRLKKILELKQTFLFSFCHLLLFSTGMKNLSKYLSVNTYIWLLIHRYILHLSVHQWTHHAYTITSYLLKVIHTLIYSSIQLQSGLIDWPRAQTLKALSKCKDGY